jgi:alkylhydroperoxidase/carboxymuconolactone decarboxylase family protein YurZ
MIRMAGEQITAIFPPLAVRGRINELPFHLRRALDNGVTREELIEAITHLAFYAGAKLRRYGLNDAEGGDE